MLRTFLTAFLMAPAEPGIDNATGGGSTIIMLAVMGALFYFMIFRPQRKKEKAEKQLRSSIEPGDEIVTIGGFTGRVLSVKDDTFTFETGPDRTKLTVKKWALQTRVPKDGGAKESAEKTEKGKGKEKPEKEQDPAQ